MAPSLPVAMDSPDSSTTGTASVPGSPSSLFSEDATSTSSSRDPTSAFATHRRRVSARFSPLENLHLDSSSVAGLILEDLTNGARSRQGPETSPNGKKNSQAIKTQRGVEKANQSSFDTSYALQDEQEQSRKSLNHIAQDELSPSKRRKVAASDGGNENESFFVVAYDGDDNREEDIPIQKTNGVSGDVESRKSAERILQGPNIKRAGKARRQPAPASEVEDSPEEESWVYGHGAGFGNSYNRIRSRRISWGPRINKAGQACRQSAISASDADERKIILDFGHWEEEEKIRKGDIGALDPINMYYHVRDSIAGDSDDDEDSNYTAAQVTLMILSLGSTKAIVDLKAIIKDMRGLSQTKVVRPPVKFGKNLEEILKLVRWVFNSTNDGTPLDNFQSRYYISGFCKYVAGRRDHLMRKNSGVTAENAERFIYARFIEHAYPDIPRYHTSQAGAAKEETSDFEEAVSQLQTKSKRGYRWLALRKKFGIGIMALYYHSKLFSETAHISLDDHDLSPQEFNLLMSYLSTKGNAHGAWLKLLCDKIKAHMTQGAEQILLQDELFVERWPVEQIMTCQEQSDLLSMMCENFDGVKEHLGNKVTKKAWKDIDRKTTLAVWLKDVEKGVYGKLQGKSQ